MTPEENGAFVSSCSQCGCRPCGDPVPDLGTNKSPCGACLTSQGGGRSPSPSQTLGRSSRSKEPPPMLHVSFCPSATSLPPSLKATVEEGGFSICQGSQKTIWIQLQRSTLASWVIPTSSPHFCIEGVSVVIRDELGELHPSPLSVSLWTHP